MKSDTVDCSLYPARLAGTISLQEVAPHASYLFPVAAMPYVIAVNDAKWKTLPAPLQKAMTDAAANLYERTKKPDDDAAAETAAQKKLEEGGAKFQADFSEADRKAFLDAAAVTWLDLAKGAGAQAVTWREQVLKALGR